MRSNPPIFLSHPFDPTTPTWLDNPPPTFESYSSIDAGDVCNQQVISTLTHNGTHVDASLHFDPLGRSITEYPPEFWCFERPTVIDVPREDGELIGSAELEPHMEALERADLAFVRTGFERHRGDRERYGRRAPGFGADAAPLLRSMPRLRALGMDIPSASSPLALDEGIAFHRAILDDAPGAGRGRGIVLIEDVHLERVASLAAVVVAPWLLRGSDGAQVTIFGWATDTEEKEMG